MYIVSSEKLTLKLNKEGIYAGDLDIMLDGLEYDLRTLGIEPPASTVNTNSTNTAEEQTAGMTSDSLSHPLENANQDSEEDLLSRDQRAARTASQQRTSAATLAAGAAAVAGTRTASTTPGIEEWIIWCVKVVLSYVLCCCVSCGSVGIRYCSDEEYSDSG